MKSKKTAKAAVADYINDELSYCREYAPNLLLARATLIPFNDLIEGESAGPQPNCAGDHGKEPYILLTITDIANPWGGETYVEITAKSVTVTQMLKPVDDEEEAYVGDEFRTTLEGLWDYLRQIPRSISSFRRK